MNDYIPSSHLRLDGTSDPRQERQHQYSTDKLGNSKEIILPQKLDHSRMLDKGCILIPELQCADIASDCTTMKLDIPAGLMHQASS